MKKFIYTISFAMACGLAANAAPVSKPQLALSPQALKSLQLPQGPMEFERVSDDGPRKSKRQVASAADFVGTYKWSGRNQLSEEFFPNEGIMTITASESDPNKLYIQGFCASFEEDEDRPGWGTIYPDGTILNATFDAATGHLEIPNQDAFYMSYYGENARFTNYTVHNGIGKDEETGEDIPVFYIIEAPEDHPFYFSLTDTGIRAGDPDVDKWNNHTYTDEELLNDICLAACQVWLADEKDYGFQWLCNAVSGKALREFNYIEDQWQKLGVAEFTDAWFPIFWEDNNYVPVPYNVDLYFDKTQPGRYLLYNPYGPGTPYEELNMSDKPGFLIFDITDPECVVFEPLIYSATFEMRIEDEIELDSYYCTNAEGVYYYMQNATKEDIIISMERDNMDISNLNARQNLVSIYNAYFTLGLNVTYYQWPNVLMEGSIVLPPNYMDGVETILGENADAPAVYFNLQGQRVINPEKGQIVIMKKGNKVYKQIMR